MTFGTDNWYEKDLANYFLQTRIPVRGKRQHSGNKPLLANAICVVKIAL